MMNKTIWRSILIIFETKTKPQNNLKKVKVDVIKSAMTLLKGRKMLFKTFESGIFSKINE